jgi:hypothetical protein
MMKFRLMLAVLGLCAAATACASKTEDKENMLSSSGFKTMPPATPTQLAWFKTLPPHKLAKKINKGETVWVYADPTICGCLYVGNQDAYNAYAKKAAQAKATDAIEAADAHMALESMPDFLPAP